jgi:hypothetical protein
MNDRSPSQVSVWMARAIAYLVYVYVLISEFILLQGFLLKLLGANPGSSYVDWAYRSLERVMSPFRGIFESVELDGNAVLDTSIIFAMVIYGIGALLVRSLLDWLTYRLQVLESTAGRPPATPNDVATAYTAGFDAAATATIPIPTPGPTAGVAPVSPVPAPEAGTQ